jgi:hypothetical protein
MVASTAARSKKLSTSHLNNNTPIYLHNSQFSMNPSDNVTYFIGNYTYCNKIEDTNYSFNMYHQNIQGQKGKINEFHALITLGNAPPDMSI